MLTRLRTAMVSDGSKHFFRAIASSRRPLALPSEKKQVSRVLCLNGAVQIGRTPTQEELTALLWQHMNRTACG
jgi:hypothetical protein